jgi:hypothetical protein
MRKLRKTGAVDQEGNLITIPRLRSVTGANKPRGWNRWSAAEKVEHLLRLSLDRDTIEIMALFVGQLSVDR